MAVESYIRAGETTQAASLQDQLLKRFRGGVEEAKELWNRFAMLYLGASELDQYAETVLQLVDYLSGRKEYREAIGQLDGPIQRCEQLGAFRVVNRLLQRRAEIARMTKDWLEVGDSLASLAGAHDRLGESLRAFETLHQAAVAYLEAEEEDRASQLFEDAVSRGSKIMSPTELGWYCYKEIAVEAYAKRGLYVQAFAWIERGSAHFAQDAETSLKRLEGHWSEQAKEVDRIASQMAAAESASRKQELEEKRRGELMMRGLAELSLAMVFYASAQLSENKTLLPRVREWLEKADASFKSSADIEIVRALESVAARLSKG